MTITCRYIPQINQPAHTGQGKSVFPVLVCRQAKPISIRVNHPTPGSSKFHCPIVPREPSSSDRVLLAPPHSAAPNPGSRRHPEGLQPPACPAAASEPRDDLLLVSPSGDLGKMAALTAENFAALQSLLKVNWRGGDSVRRAFVPRPWDGIGIGTKWIVIQSHESNHYLSG